MEQAHARPPRSIDDPFPAPWHHVAMHGVRQLVAAAILPRYRSGRKRIERLAAEGVVDFLPHIHHVAVLHWENLGDAVILSGLLRELRRNLPDAEITLIHNAATAALFERCPYVDRRFEVEVRTDGLKRIERSYAAKMWSSARLLRRASRRMPIDVVLGPDWLDTVAGRSMWDNLLCRRAGGPTIVSARERVGMEVVIEVRQHHVPRTFRVLEVLGAVVADDRMEVWLDGDDEAEAEAVLGDEHRPLAVLAPGASVARRCWPADRFAELARWLQDERGLRVVVLGGAVDRDRPGVPELLATLGIIDAMGRLTLRSSAAVIRRAAVFVGNDSGPAHLAAAVGTPTVVVSAHPADGEPWMFNSPMRYRPWGVPNEVLQPARAAAGCVRGCTADEAHCIAQVPVSTVHDAVEHMLADAPR